MLNSSSDKHIEIVHKRFKYRAGSYIVRQTIPITRGTKKNTSLFLSRGTRHTDFDASDFKHCVSNIIIN